MVLENLMTENIKKEEKEHLKNINHSKCLLYCDVTDFKLQVQLTRVSCTFIYLPTPEPRSRALEPSHGAEPRS